MPIDSQRHVDLVLDHRRRGRGRAAQRGRRFRISTDFAALLSASAISAPLITAPTKITSTCPASASRSARSNAAS